MPERTWFFAFEGKQYGPYPEAQLRGFITKGLVTPETLVWTDGMAGWQNAGEIRGLISSGPRSPAAPRSPALPRGYAEVVEDTPSDDGALSIDLPMWSFLGRVILCAIGMMLVIPAPWVATSLYRWMASRTAVPGRPNFAFDGKVGDIWYVFVMLGLTNYVASAFSFGLLIAIPVQAFLTWMAIQWIVGRLSSNGEPLPIAFTGSAATYVGWYVLMFLSSITIIGWAWVATAWIRWMCRNVTGARRQIAFNATGLELLWWTLVAAIGSVFLIPIPWVLRWHTQWLVSQFALGERRLDAEA